MIEKHIILNLARVARNWDLSEPPWLYLPYHLVGNFTAKFDFDTSYSSSYSVFGQMVFPIKVRLMLMLIILLRFNWWLVLRWCQYIPCKFVPKEDTVFHIFYWKEATCHAFYEQSTLNSCKQAMLILHRLLQVPESICVLICGACTSLSFSLDGLDSNICRHV